MLVYGDHCDLACPNDRLAQIRSGIERVHGMRPGMARHAALQSLLIEAGRLEQGLADADFAEARRDSRTGRQNALGALTYALAAALLRSWRSSGTEMGQLPILPQIPDIPPEVALKVPEGFAFYAVYPEAFADAALALKLLDPPRVIGIRSIGTTLAAIVAAALGAPPPVTVRPFGDPFDRRIHLDAALQADLLAAPAHFIIVDEGPGLSGSSFGAVADWLEARGVPADKIAFMPSHAGAPGAQALPRHRERWARAQRVAGEFGPDLGALVTEWTCELLGPAAADPEDLSGGQWRNLLFGTKDGPVSNPVWERRKYLIHAQSGEWLARFAGLGGEGERKLEIAHTLHDCGMVPEPAGLANGFLVERWHGEAQPLADGEQPLEEMADYLGARARLLPVPRPGADLSMLLDMARRNAGLALGSWAEERLSDWAPRLKALQHKVVPTCTDGRMDRHEWLRLPDGRLLKSDAVDHHAAHDLIGCQDLGWDVAGAAVEFELSPDQTRWLAAAAGRAASRLVDPDLLAFHQQAYLAFRLGQATMSADMCSAPDSDRWRGRARRYATALETHLRAWEGATTRGKASIGQAPERTGAGTILMSQG